MSRPSPPPATARSCPATSAAPSSSACTATGGARTEGKLGLLLDGVQNPFNVGRHPAHRRRLLGRPPVAGRRALAHRRQGPEDGARLPALLHLDRPRDLGRGRRRRPRGGLPDRRHRAGRGRPPAPRGRPLRPGLPGHRPRGPRPLEGAARLVRRARLHPPARPHRLAQRGHRHRHRLLRGPPHRLDLGPSRPTGQPATPTSPAPEAAGAARPGVTAMANAQAVWSTGRGGHDRPEKPWVAADPEDGVDVGPRPVGRASTAAKPPSRYTWTSRAWAGQLGVDRPASTRTPPGSAPLTRSSDARRAWFRATTAERQPSRAVALGRLR